MSKVAEAMELLGTGILNGIRKRAVVTARYPSLDANRFDERIVILQELTAENAAQVYESLVDDLQSQEPDEEGNTRDLFPIASEYSGMMFCLDLAVWPERRVCYLDWDFGIFDLGPLDEFLSKLE